MDIDVFRTNGKTKVYIKDTENSDGKFNEKNGEKTGGNIGDKTGGKIGGNSGYFSYNMIKRNKNLGIIAPYENIIDGEKTLVYEMDNGLSLEDYLFNNYDGKEVQEILRDIFCKIEICSDYFLDASKLILNPDYIYIESNRIVKMLYCEHGNADIRKEMADLVRKIIDSIPDGNREDRIVLYKLYNEIISEFFEVKKCRDILDGLDKPEHNKFNSNNNLHQSQMSENISETKNNNKIHINNKQLISSIITVIFSFIYALSPLVRGDVSGAIDYYKLAVGICVIIIAGVYAFSKLTD